MCVVFLVADRVVLCPAVGLSVADLLGRRLCFGLAGPIDLLPFLVDVELAGEQTIDIGLVASKDTSSRLCLAGLGFKEVGVFGNVVVAVRVMVVLVSLLQFCTLGACWVLLAQLLPLIVVLALNSIYLLLQLGIQGLEVGRSIGSSIVLEVALLFGGRSHREKLLLLVGLGLHHRLGVVGSIIDRPD
jgi:hypothetical protein